MLLSQKYKQLTNQLQFDYDLSLTMNRRDSLMMFAAMFDTVMQLFSCASFHL